MDLYQIAKRRGIWNILDLTNAAVERARARFKLSKIKYGNVKQGTATDIPWKDNSFYLVYSHGVLHHIPRIKDVSSEIYRVLKPEGRLVMLLYSKRSMNYYLSIRIVRRVGLILLWAARKCRISSF